MLGRRGTVNAADECKFQFITLKRVKLKQKFKFKFYYNKINYHMFLQGAGRRMINILLI